MGLENVFGKVEKPVEEKKLEVIMADETALIEWLAYFKRLTPPDFDTVGLALASFKEYLQTFHITPQIITKFCATVNTEKFERVQKSDFGVFLSALIQTSYSQGNNGFQFEEINANCFGAFLEGKKGDEIRIKADKINGNETLWFAKYCDLMVEEVKGNYALERAENCSLTVKDLNGNYTLWEAEDCVAEIIWYHGYNFGFGMEDCIIYSPNPKTFLRLGKSFPPKSNSFCFGNLPTEE
ncbi:hypothetical protein HY643_03775 [Candidatus Woesearchaeota archaeon]|nr:hypothetical protein [Candidatus Woesearchaeota archaeon]